jgi:WD40 repeat protein
MNSILNNNDVQVLDPDYSITILKSFALPQSAEVGGIIQSKCYKLLISYMTSSIEVCNVLTLRSEKRILGNDTEFDKILEHPSILGVIICAGSDGSISLFHLFLGFLVCKIPEAHRAAVSNLCVLAEKIFVTNSPDDKLCLWKVNLNRQIKKQDSFTIKGQFSPSPLIVISNDVVATCSIYDVLVYNISKGEMLYLKGHNYKLSSLSLFGDNHDLLASSSFDASLRIWNYKDQTCLKCFQNTSIPYLITHKDKLIFIRNDGCLGMITSQMTMKKITPNPNFTGIFKISANLFGQTLQHLKFFRLICC